MRIVLSFVGLIGLVLGAVLSPAATSAQSAPAPHGLYAVSAIGINSLYMTAKMPLPQVGIQGGFGQFQKMFASRDGAHLFVSGPTSDWMRSMVAVFDRTPTNTVRLQFTQNMPVSGNLVAISPDGQHLYFARSYCPASNCMYVLDVSGSSLMLESTQLPITAHWILAAAVSPDNSVIYVLGTDDTYFRIVYVQRYSAVSHQPIGSPIYVGPQSNMVSTSMVVGPDGRVWVTNPGNASYQAADAGHTLSVIETNGSVWSLDLGTTGTVPQSLAIRPDGRYVYAGNHWGGNVVVVDTTPTPHVMAHIDLGNPNGGDPKYLAMTPDGTTVYVSENSPNTSGQYPVAVINTTANSRVLPDILTLPNARSALVVAPFPASFGVGDDYPATMSSSQCSGGICYMASAPFPTSYNDPWLEYSRQCVSFAAWRLYRDGHPVPNDSSGNPIHGFAYQWSGWPTSYPTHVSFDTTPHVGDIAQWNAGDSYWSFPNAIASNLPDHAHGGVGHVAYITSMEADNTIWVEDYNFNLDGNYRAPLHLHGATHYLKFQ